MGIVDGKVALVSGGGRGIGEAACTVLHEEGATVIIADIEEDRSVIVARALGKNAVPMRLDVTDPLGWADTVARTIEIFGCLDILVNNAGIGGWGIGGYKGGGVVEENLEMHRRLIEVNLTGVWSGMRAVLPQMMKQKRGSIVNVSSIDGLAGAAQNTSYAATKFAVTGMTKSVALEVGRDGIRVNSVHPGITQTPLVGESSRHPRLAEALARQPIARIATAREIAQAILFFASDSSTYCTGTSLVVDGGHLAGPYRMPR